MQPDHKAEAGAERRKEKRLPEELLAVITDNAVAAKLIDGLPEERKQAEATWVAAGSGRKDRARRAVEVVRHAMTARPEDQEDPLA
jgi:uncharacterized protein YdeI (YjbR/CyaY-like superfamily)